ncbi:MAG: hypothetical protein COT74_02005 [Bdellovibrionales bacterium CG10_big_fil_rev_8_21_14_0_10_45_34]|nr:MAG: hypothetical protein COT74_02005 [Bdellovibrionales bacterium CG10_big_fil_rev_8_21_14_0_10_45_34]
MKTVKDLVQGENFIGWAYYIDYQKAHILTNDLWKFQINGIPHNCFLIAASFDPSSIDEVDEIDQEVILLRVTGTTKLPQDDDLVRGRIDYYQQQKDAFKEKGLDPITLNQMQFGGLECRVLGTFYVRDGNLWLGSDVESFPSASRLRAFRPNGEILETIVNYIDPIRKQKSIDDAKEIGLRHPPAPFYIGTVRYTSTTRLQTKAGEQVRVSIQPSDFLARRTAVLGMTRTGKSNMIKQLVSVVLKTSKDGNLPIGQLVFDLNGEYANANKQDHGSIADVFPTRTVRYRMIDTDGFLPLQNNFYEQLADGFALLSELLTEKKNSGGDVQHFLGLSFDQPESGDWGEISKFSIKKAAYWGLLCRSGFKTNSKLVTKFKVAKEVNEIVSSYLNDGDGLEPENGMTPEECRNWFSALREAYKDEQKSEKSSRSKSKNDDEGEDDRKSNKKKTISKWVDSKDDARAMMNMMCQKNEKDSFILGFQLLTDIAKFHTPNRSSEVGVEIYGHLAQGKVVILDLSVGRPSLRERITKKIAEKVFNLSMDKFVSGTTPPNVVLYIEEAHNLIGKDSDLDDTWPRIAKEGAKYKISLVYATQEVSAMHPNILANTENWFITHLNNIREVNELSKFYDFGDFSDSLIRAQDVGFARVKTLSGPYVVPVQIDKFDPAVLKEK